MDAATTTKPDPRQTQVSHVSPAEFRSLAVSHRRMVREDNAHNQTRGLRDLETGELFVIDERALRATPR